MRKTEEGRTLCNCYNAVMEIAAEPTIFDPQHVFNPTQGSIKI